MQLEDNKYLLVCIYLYADLLVDPEKLKIFENLKKVLENFNLKIKISKL